MPPIFILKRRTEEDRTLDMIRSKDNKNRYLGLAVHFTDINFLGSILRKGIYSTNGSFSNLYRIKELNGERFSGALGTYRGMYDRSFASSAEESEYQKGSLRTFFEHEQHKDLLNDKSLITESELKTIKHIQKIYQETMKNYFSSEDIKKAYEIIARVRARDRFYTITENKNSGRSSMNICLIFREDAISNPEDAYGHSNLFHGNTIRIKEDSKINGIMTYEINLEKIIDIMRHNIKKKEDLVPIYNYDAKVIWPNFQ